MPLAPQLEFMIGPPKGDDTHNPQNAGKVCSILSKKESFGGMGTEMCEVFDP